MILNIEGNYSTCEGKIKFYSFEKMTQFGYGISSVHYNHEKNISEIYFDNFPDGDYELELELNEKGEEENKKDLENKQKNLIILTESRQQNRIKFNSTIIYFKVEEKDQILLIENQKKQKLLKDLIFKRKDSSVVEQFNNIWLILHTISIINLKHSIEPQQLIILLDGIPDYIGCPICKHHYEIFLKNYKLTKEELSNDSEKFFIFICDLHNDVNNRSNRGKWEYETTRKVYSTNYEKKINYLLDTLHINLIEEIKDIDKLFEKYNSIGKYLIHKKYKVSEGFDYSDEKYQNIQEKKIITKSNGLDMLFLTNDTETPIKCNNCWRHIIYQEDYKKCQVSNVKLCDICYNIHSFHYN